MKFVSVVILTAALVGCAGYKTPSYAPDYAAVDALKASKISKLAVADVKPVESDAPVNNITLRGSKLVVDNGTFATYLQNAVISDLKEIGAYDANSGIKLSFTILKNDIDVSGVSVGTGTLNVQLVIEKNSNIVLDKNYDVGTKFESSFGGMVAIPKGQNEYPNLVKKLLATIYADKQFVAAVKR